VSVYVTIEDDKLHQWSGGIFLLCGKVMVREARKDEIAIRRRCEECQQLRDPPERGRTRPSKEGMKKGPLPRGIAAVSN
jgi:hypothetical protein